MRPIRVAPLARSRSTSSAGRARRERLSVSAFAEREGLDEERLYRWRRRFARERKAEARAVTPPATPAIVELEVVLADERAALVAERQRAADIEAKHDRLHEAFRQLQFELELLKRRLFHAKAERIDTGQLELEFAAKLAALDTFAGQLQSNEAPAGPAAGASKDDSSKGGPRGSKGKAQQRRVPRDFNELDLPEERIEVPDLELDGKVERIGTEESSKVMWRRGGFCRVVFARIKYKPA